MKSWQKSVLGNKLFSSARGSNEPLLGYQNSINNEDKKAVEVSIDYSRPVTTSLLSENQLMIEDTIKPFLEWCYRDAFDLIQMPLSQQVKKYAAIGVGVTLGGLSVASIYPLGGNFGNNLSDYFKVQDPAAREAIWGSVWIPRKCSQN